MATFLIGLVILICGGALYGKFCENTFGPDDRETPAYSRQDGVDYVPMKTWRNSLINLLNIAGTGPIMGPIQGILFGPAAFLAIPIGNVIGGSMHDYFSGMICTRDGGTQMPDFVKDYTNRTVYVLYDVFICLLLLLVGAVFIYTPGDIATTQIFKWSGAAAVTGVVCRDALGSIGGTIALIGVVVLPITSGDTALRALRLTLADSLHIRQENNKQRIALAAPVFALVFVILLWAKRDAEGFSRLWRYFAWSNQMISLFALACIAAWMFKSGKSKFVWVPLIPAAFYAFATCSFIVHNPKQLPGASVMSWTAAYIIAAVFTICYLALCVVNGRKKAAQAKA